MAKEAYGNEQDRAHGIPQESCLKTSTPGASTIGW